MSTDTRTAADDAAEITHPGLLWLDDGGCAQLEDDLADAKAEARARAEEAGEAPPDFTGDNGALGLFFVDAGHVISEETLNVCRACPVRRECIIHAYLGGPGTPGTR